MYVQANIIVRHRNHTYFTILIKLFLIPSRVYTYIHVLTRKPAARPCVIYAGAVGAESPLHLRPVVTPSSTFRRKDHTIRSSMAARVRMNRSTTK
jgi:hypothetical protein